MNAHELILLSPYRLPTQSSLMVGNEDVGAFFNGYLALWHPAIAQGATAPPRVGSPYDHEQPASTHAYALPDQPPLFLPDDWDGRVTTAGAVAFKATLDRNATLESLRTALRARGDLAPPATLIDLPEERVAAFLGIGFGYLNVEGLFEAMEHENLLPSAELWADVQQAIAALDRPEDPEAWRRHLQDAANKLLSAREILYPVTIHLLDIHLLDESHPERKLPVAHEGIAQTILGSTRALEAAVGTDAEAWTRLRDRVATEQTEVVGGSAVEREDVLLPVESQLWNLRKGLHRAQERLGSEIRVFGRKRFGFHPHLPLFLNSFGINRAVLLAFDDSVVPSHRTAVVSWPSPDGKQVEAFTRTPYPAESPQTFFHVAHYLHKTIMQDHAATFVLLHKGDIPAAGYRDWQELCRFGPVLGTWTTITRYLTEVMAGEYLSATPADDFHGDHLCERSEAKNPAIVSGFARHWRRRRRLDSAQTLAAIHRGLAGHGDTLRVEARLAELEDRLESLGANGDIVDPVDTDLEALEKETAEALAQRLVSRAVDETPGTLVLNPCSFARRVVLELDSVKGPLPLGGPIKAGQFEGSQAKLVVEVPPLGFAWVPHQGPPGTAAPPARMKLADARGVRNEFLEAEIDPTTGGLRGVRDQRTRLNRLSQQLVYNPGSIMKARSVSVTSSGTALGEVVSEGVLVDEHDRELATFRQRFRAWLGRPILDLRVEITPTHRPEGYPWHTYYGCRFAWADERSVLLRGVNGAGYVTTHTRPESPEWLEVRSGKMATQIFPGGLPFHQRHGGRMLDVILVPEGETTMIFDLAIGLDREYPTQTALGLATPVTLVQTVKGPPHVGATGWLFHLDMPNLVLLGMRPAADGADAIVARLLECAGRATYAEFRSVRNPTRAGLQDASGAARMDVSTSGDAVLFELGANDLADLRVDFGSP